MCSSDLVDRSTTTNLAAALRGAGFGVTPLSCADLAAEGVLSAARFDALVLPDARRFPGPAADALSRFLRSGGDLVLLGGLPFAEPVWPADGEWVTEAELAGAVATTPDGTVLHDFEDGKAPRWSRSSNATTNPSAVSVENGPHGRCLRVDVRGLSGWDNVRTPFPGASAGGANALALWAKGDAATPKLAIELREEDGSRWIATLDLTTEWRRHVLPAWRFGYWRDSRVTGRGGAGDGLNLARARELTVGQSFSHTGNLPGDHTFWIDGLALAASPVPRPGVFDLELPVGSDYGVYRLDDIREAVASPGQAIVPAGARLAGPLAGWSAIGFAFPGESRYVPLLDARDRHGRVRGAAAGMLVHHRGAWRDSCWLFSGLEGGAFARDPDFAPVLVAALTAMRSGDPVRGARAAAREAPADPALATPPPHAGFIRRSPDGRHLVLPDGRRFFMIGCNYIGTFDRCGGRMWLDAYYDPRLVEDDFRKARDAGLNVMRYWLQPSFDEALRRGDRRAVDAIREYARRYGVYLLLDLPGTGYATEAEMLASHRAIAAAFADEPMVLGYDLRNEPYVTTLGGIRYEGGPVPVQSRDLRGVYRGGLDDATLARWLEERPYWLHLPGTIKGAEAANVAVAWHFWAQYAKQHNLGASTLAGLGAEVPVAGWEELVKTVDASLDRWLRCQVAAIRSVDTNHLITVGHNTALAVLPANAQLDFVSQHIYARPLSYEAVMENLTTLDRLAKRWPDRPVSLGEFGYSNGVRMKDGHLDPYTSSVGEMAHYLHALAHGYEGCKKWMLVDWPLAVMRRYGDWNRGLETRIYEERFGLYSYDGTPGGRAKPVVPALRFLRDHVDRAGPGGELTVSPGPTTIGAVYEFRAPGARFVGHVRYESTDLRFEAPRPANVMLRWDGARLRVMSTADATVRLRPAAFVPSLRPGGAVAGACAARPADGDWLVLEMLEGETVTLGPGRGGSAVGSA